ncbi:MAG TPA: S8 family serine peptidase [Thermoanaerobaculia bacterium]|nr:S8 family serine peptidase [Thermoanaerobaculia bacterium]
MRRLFVSLLLTLTASANEYSYRSLQSGSPAGPTPLHDRGLRGEGQIIAVLDSGLEYRSCYFAEADGSAPPFNTGVPGGGFGWTNVDSSRRKVIAYNFLYSCDQYPGAFGCDAIGAADALDNHGHGTHAAGAAAGDSGAPGQHDFADAIAPAAKLVIQDAGLTTGDACTQYPGIGCPAVLTPIFEQAYRQGARIHSNSWGDRQGVPAPLPPPRANYSDSARDVDAFAWAHPDSLVVFNSGNYTGNGAPPLHTVSSPGSAKNTLQVGGTRFVGADDDTLAPYTPFGPTRDGRIKPDVVAPAKVTAGDFDTNHDGIYCEANGGIGTSWAAPTIAGAAALVRQYYTDGFYPTGIATPAHRFTPSAALLKATIIAAARAVPWRRQDNEYLRTLPVPSHEQGWGFPVLDDVLFFPGDTRTLRVVDVPLAQGLAQNQSSTIRINARAGTPLKAVLVWTDPPGTPRGATDTTPQLVNDLDLRVNGTGGTDHINNVEAITIAEPSGTYEIAVSATRLGFGTRQSYALVITGDFTAAAGRTRAVRH